jgi:hypothetical protein
MSSVQFYEDEYRDFEDLSGVKCQAAWRVRNCDNDPTDWLVFDCDGKLIVCKYCKECLRFKRSYAPRLKGKVTSITDQEVHNLKLIYGVHGQ